jgi:DNA-binding NtrC family response regulator
MAHVLQKARVTAEPQLPLPEIPEPAMSHILIVEDEPTTSWALAEGLADDGFTIDTFRSAEEALAWLADGRCDLVIADLRLPGMSGIELAGKLKRGRSACPVILVSAYGSERTPRELRRAGIVEYFTKPFQVDALRRSVRIALAESGATRGTGVRKAA